MKKMICCTCVLFLFLAGNAQSPKDTLAWIEDVQKVMSFLDRPKVAYHADLRLSSTPVLDSQDTLASTADYFKDGSTFSYRSDIEEVYQEDSLLVEVNHQRKSIWLSRSGNGTAQSVSGGFGQKVRAMLAQRYSVQREQRGENTIVMTILPKVVNTASPYRSKMVLEYDRQSELPRRIDITISMEAQASDEMIEDFKARGVAVESMLREVNGDHYLVREQTMSLRFGKITELDSELQKAPKLAGRVKQNPATGAFMGVGTIQDYEITQTF